MKKSQLQQQEGKGEPKSVAAFVYNPLQIQMRVVRLEVPGGPGTLRSSMGSGSFEVEYDQICTMRGNNTRLCEVWFLDQIGTNQLKSCTWSRSEVDPNYKKYECEEQQIDFIDSEDVRIQLFNNESLVIKDGVLTDFVYTTQDGESHAFSLPYDYYPSFQRNDGYGEEDRQESGAYIF